MGGVWRWQICSLEGMVFQGICVKQGIFANVQLCEPVFFLMSTPVLMHGGLICITFYLSVCHDLTKIQTRKYLNKYDLWSPNLHLLRCMALAGGLTLTSSLLHLLVRGRPLVIWGAWSRFPRTIFFLKTLRSFFSFWDDMNSFYPTLVWLNGEILLLCWFMFIYKREIIQQQNFSNVKYTEVSIHSQEAWSGFSPLILSL